MAFVGHTLAQTPHLPVVSFLQYCGLMLARLGMACGNGMLMAVVLPTFSLKWSGTFLVGHFSVQVPQPVHLDQST